MNERGFSKRLRFDDEAREAVTVDVTSGQLGPKSAPDPAPPGKAKRRLLFEDEQPPHDLPPPDKPKSRLRFEDDSTIQGLPPPPHKVKERLRFEDEDAPPAEAPADTSGQVGPKLKQQSVFRQAETPAPDSRAAPGADTNSPKSNKKAAQEARHLEKSKLRVEKTEAKLDNAREKLAAQQSPKPPGSVRQLGQRARFYAWAYTHKKIHEVEHENVGTESAHKTELTAEGVYRGTSRFVKKRIRNRPARRVRKLTKRNVRAKTNHAYQKLLQDNPALRKKALARLYHKQRLKMRYARQAKQAAQATKQGGGIIARTTAKLSNAAIALVKNNPKVWVIAILGLVLFFLLQSCMAMITTIGNSMGGVVVGSSYLAEDGDIDAVTVLYTEWETDLHYRIMNAERDYPDFDEYRYSIGDISHNPFELIAFLTAVYHDFTYAEVRATLYEIFNEQYRLELNPEVEIRTRIETRTGTGTGSWTDLEGEVHYYEYEYEYEVEVEYEWHILNIELTSQSFRDIVLSRMDGEQTEHFDILMLTKGNRQHLQSPFDFNWLPFVSSLYGYRIHPISCERARHWGLDIGLPQGTEILAGQAGTVIFAADGGGYGLLVVIDNGEGLISRYAHCSVLYVTVGQEVNVGDVIARVGSTGNSTGPHLHLEIINNGRHLNPLIFTVTNHHLGF